MKVAVLWKGLLSIAVIKNVTNIAWNENTTVITGVPETSSATTPNVYTYDNDKCVIRILEN